MKIGILGPAEPFRGGIAQFLQNMADELAKEHEVVVFNFIKQYPRLIFPGKSQLEEVKPPLPTHPFTPPERGVAIYRILTPYEPWTWRKAAKFIIAQDIECLMIKFWIPFFCPAYRYIINYLKKHSQVKVHVLCHNIDFHERWLFANLLTKSMLKRSDSLIVLSENVYKSAVRLNHKRIIKLFHPSYKISPEIVEKSASFEYLNIPQKPTVLFFGFIKPYKGLDVLLRAAPIVSKALPDVQFLVAGEAYKQWTVDSGQWIVEGNEVIFRNEYIPMSEALHYFNIADVVVVPYRTATQSGIVQLAYSYGKPVIASDIDGLREMVLVNETGLLFRNGDHDDLAEKIVGFYKVYSGIDYRENIRLFNEDYSWEKFVIQLNNI